MAFVYLLSIISIIGMIIYRLFKWGTVPSNKYTPIEHISEGKIVNIKHDMPFQDTKHEIAYEEIDHIE